VFALRAHHGTLTGLRVLLLRGKKVLARTPLARLGSHRHLVTLPIGKAGHYIVAITQGPATVSVLRLHVR
jgi:hypothetical protein